MQKVYDKGKLCGEREREALKRNAGWIESGERICDENAVTVKTRKIYI